MKDQEYWHGWNEIASLWNKLGDHPTPNPEVWEPQEVLLAQLGECVARMRAVTTRHRPDSDVEPGPEGRAAIIEEREANGFRQIVAGPKTTERTEVVS